jgi:endo-1,4-beta-xylanase
MITYIKHVVKEFGDDIFAWDVVNEAIENNGNAKDPIKTSPWKVIPDFICKAFNAAHETNPNIELFYNDYKHASKYGKWEKKSDRVYELVKGLKERGCPVHGIGFQNHWDMNFSDAEIEGIRVNVARYAELGVKIHFTESDVRCNFN